MHKTMFFYYCLSPTPLTTLHVSVKLIHLVNITIDLDSDSIQSTHRSPLFDINVFKREPLHHNLGLPYPVCPSHLHKVAGRRPTLSYDSVTNAYYNIFNVANRCAAIRGVAVRATGQEFEE